MINLKNQCSTHNSSLKIKPSVSNSDLIDMKFKDSKPEETISKIKGILKEVGISTNEIWNDSQVKGCYSVRIELQGSRVGQNGKGMTKELATASAYAELMERLQTGYFYIGNQDDELTSYRGFTYIPEEIGLSIEEVLEQNELWLDQLYNLMIDNSSKYFTKQNFLEMLAYKKHTVTEKDFIAIPFYEIKTGRKIHIPNVILENYYLTNGTCAGNSVNEAIVQGISEIVERHNNLKIHNKCMIPPDIPEEYLAKYHQIYQIILSIRMLGTYELLIKDCSLGEGFPVVASVLINKEKKSYIIKFGAHPVFEIALERSMTELFQGRNLNNAAVVGSLLYDTADAEKIDIIHNVVKNSSGLYHYSFFGGQADYSFVPFDDRSGMDNEQLFSYAADFIHEKGHEIYFRNASYLGFYSFQIIVPAYSEIYTNGILRIKEKISHEKAADTIKHLTGATESDCMNLITYMKYKEYFALENTLEYFLKLPMNKEQGVKNSYQVYFLACLRLKKYHMAKKICEVLLHFPLGREESEYFRCVSMYLSLLEHEEKIDIIIGCIVRFFDRTLVDLVLEDFRDFNRMTDKFAISCNDYRCSDCKNIIYCDYLKLKDIIMKLKDYFQKSAPLEQYSLVRGIRIDLSKREKAVAGYYVQGYTRKQIADQLYVSENTIKKHLISIYQKAGTNNRSEVYEAVRDVL